MPEPTPQPPPATRLPMSTAKAPAFGASMLDQAHNVCTSGFAPTADIATFASPSWSQDTLLGGFYELEWSALILYFKRAAELTRTTRPNLIDLDFKFQDFRRSLSRDYDNPWQQDFCPQCNHQLILDTIGRLEASDDDDLDEPLSSGSSQEPLHLLPKSLFSSTTESTLGLSDLSTDKRPLLTPSPTKHQNGRHARTRGPDFLKHGSIPRQQRQGAYPGASTSTTVARMATPFFEWPDCGLDFSSEKELGWNSSALDTGRNRTAGGECHLREHALCERDTSTGPLSETMSSDAFETLNRDRQVLMSLVDARVWEGEEASWDRAVAAASILLVLPEVLGGFFEWRSRQPCPKTGWLQGDAMMLLRV